MHLILQILEDKIYVV